MTDAALLRRIATYQPPQRLANEGWTLCRRPDTKNMSVIWQYGAKLENKNVDSNLWACLASDRCVDKQTIVKLSHNSTSNALSHLRNHHEKCPPGIPKGTTPRKKKKLDGRGKIESEIKMVPQKVYNRDRFERCLIQFLIQNELSLDVCQSLELRNLLHCLDITVKLPKPKALKTSILNLYQIQIREITEFFKYMSTKISLTASITNIDHSTYVEITYHCANGSGTTSNLLDFIKLSEQAVDETNEEIANAILNTIKKYQLQSKQIISISLETCGGIMPVFMKNLGIREVDVNDNIEWIECFANALNRSCDVTIMYVKEEISKIKNLAIMLRNTSELRKEIFGEEKPLNKDYQNLIQLLDGEENWRTSFLYMENILKLQSLLRLKPLLIGFNEEDWKKINEMVEFLRMFYDMVLIMSKVAYPTVCNVVPMFNVLVGYAKEQSKMGPSPFIHQVANSVSEMLESSYDKQMSIFLICVVLNPRFNISYYVEDENANSKTVQSIKKHMKRVYTLYEERMEQQQDIKEEVIREKDKEKEEQISNIGTSNTHTHGNNGYENESTNTMMNDEIIEEVPPSILSSRLFKRRRTTQSSELELYYQIPSQGENIDPLKWWEANKRSYPILYQMALDYLCIPATCVSTSKIFATTNEKAGDLLAAMKCIKNLK